MILAIRCAAAVIGVICGSGAYLTSTNCYQIRRLRSKEAWPNSETASKSLAGRTAS